MRDLRSAAHASHATILRVCFPPIAHIAGETDLVFRVAAGGVTLRGHKSHVECPIAIRQSTYFRDPFGILAARRLRQLLAKALGQDRHYPAAISSGCGGLHG